MKVPRRGRHDELSLDMFGGGTAPERTCGSDEAGRGPLAGPVVAAAVILDPRQPIEGLRDSKQLTPAQRDRLAVTIQARARAWAIAAASVEEIDRFNILNASLLAMQRAIEALDPEAEYALIDGNQLPRLAIPATAIVDGDATHPAIAAASILAKTHRDALMRVLDQDFPGYGFARHVGYATAEHLENLRRLGPCAVHRRSFLPVRTLATDFLL
jgi:ribonuclease HII